MIEVTELFDDEDEDDDFTGPPVDADRIRLAAEELGVRLPRSYVEVISQRNGGYLRHGCYPTEFPNSWAPDHIEVRALVGIGGDTGIESSPYLIAEWGYPDVGVVIAELPSGGHDTVMLDYSESGPQGEPAVVYVDEDRVPRRIANSFDEFLAGLVPCDQFDDSGDE